MKVEDAGADFRAELEVIGAEMTDAWLAEVGEKGQAILDNYNAN